MTPAILFAPVVNTIPPVAFAGLWLLAMGERRDVTTIVMCAVGLLAWGAHTIILMLYVRPRPEPEPRKIPDLSQQHAYASTVRLTVLNQKTGQRKWWDLPEGVIIKDVRALHRCLASGKPITERFMVDDHRLITQTARRKLLNNLVAKGWAVRTRRGDKAPYKVSETGADNISAYLYHNEHLYIGE